MLYSAQPNEAFQTARIEKMIIAAVRAAENLKHFRVDRLSVFSRSSNYKSAIRR